MMLLYSIIDAIVAPIELRLGLVFCVRRVSVIQPAFSFFCLAITDSFREVRSGNSNKGNRERRDSNNKNNSADPNSVKDKGRRSNNQQNLNTNKDFHHHHHPQQQGPRSPK